jgi:peptide/nickel transport system ATP-binding protein
VIVDPQRVLPTRTSVEGHVARIDDLHVVYHSKRGELHAVRGVQLTVGRGEIVALVGESGSGKTSIAMALLGLLDHASTRATWTGLVEVLGVDLLTAPADARRRLRRERVGAVFQDPMTSLNPTMPVGRQIAEIAGSTDRAASLLEAVGVADAKVRLRAYPHELSGGQRQRVMIAMAIARTPALVVADEPTTALDVTVQAQILQLIGELRDDIGCSFVLVTHDLGVAAQVADRVVVCYAGRIAESGETRGVLDQPGHPYTADLLDSRITLNSDRLSHLPTLRGEPPDPRNWPPGCAYAPRCLFGQARCEASLPEPAAFRASRESACLRIGELELAARERRATSTWDDTLVPMRPGPIVRVVGARKSFHARSGVRKRVPLHALRGVDLTVDRGEAVALVGESGSGKSTLLRAIAGLTDLDGGTIEAGASTKPQMVFQDAAASLTPWLTCGELVGEPLRAQNVRRTEARERVAQVLEIVGLPRDAAARRPSQLSGGQRQRVALARAIAVPPAILLCDEPTSSLDVSLAATVLNLIGSLRRELGMAVLFVTHDLSAARLVADRVAVMYLGRIVEIGPAEDLVANPQHPYSKALVAAVPEVGRIRPEAKGEPPSPLRPPGGCPYHPRCLEALDVCAVEAQELRAVSGQDDSWMAACVHAGAGR